MQTLEEYLLSRKITNIGDLGEAFYQKTFDGKFVLNLDRWNRYCDGYDLERGMKVEIKTQDPLYIEGGCTVNDTDDNNSKKCKEVDILRFVVYQSNKSHPRGKRDWSKIIIYEVIDRNTYSSSYRTVIKNGQRTKEKIRIYEWDNLKVIKEVDDLAVAEMFRKYSRSSYLASE